MKKIIIIAAVWVAWGQEGQYLGKFVDRATCVEYVKSFNGTCQFYRGI